MRWQRGQDKMLHEDNTGAMILAKLEPGRMPQAALEAECGVKYHWCRSKLKPNKIEMDTNKS
jgi:hypothetical protein